MVQGSSKPLSEETTEGRHGPPQPVRHAFDPLQHHRRDGHVSRLRSRRPTRVLIEEMKPGRGFAITAAMMAWAVLLVGIGIAVVGTVQAMRAAGDEPVATGALEAQSLTRQIEQLKIDLDQERVEKQELLQKLAAVQSGSAQSEPAASPGASVTVQKADVPATAESEVPDDVDPNATVSGTEPSVAVNQPTAPPPQPTAPAPAAPLTETALPAPMAPSAELLKPAVPAVADTDAAEAGAARSFGVHLASFADRVMAERGWALLQRNHPAALGDLTPRIEDAKDEAGNPIFLLLAGPFQTMELAADHCKIIRSQVVFCKPRPFLGNELTAAQ